MKQKILMTASTWSHIRSFHLPYLREFQSLGWETHVGCPGIPADAPQTDETIELPFEKKMSAPANFRAARMLRGKIRAEQYDLIIAHTTLAAFFTRLALKGMKNRPRLVNVVHGYLFDDDSSALKRSALLMAERLTAPETDLLLAMNRYDFDLAKRHRLGKAVAMIPGVGVDFARLDAAAPSDGATLRAELGIAENDFVLLYAAEFSANKSQRVLIEAMTKLPQNAVLVLCGTGKELGSCRALAENLGLGERVRFPGHVSDMARWYRMADVAVTASRKEGLPFNVMESMHCGIPVVASAVKGHTDLITDGVTGLLYPYGDAEACAAQIGRLLKDAALRQKLGEQAREHVAPYGLETVLPQVMELYCAAV